MAARGIDIPEVQMVIQVCLEETENVLCRLSALVFSLVGCVSMLSSLVCILPLSPGRVKKEEGHLGLRGVCVQTNHDDDFCVVILT